MTLFTTFLHFVTILYYKLKKCNSFFKFFKFFCTKIKCSIFQEHFLCYFSFAALVSVPITSWASLVVRTLKTGIHQSLYSLYNFGNCIYSCTIDQSGLWTTTKHRSYSRYHNDHRRHRKHHTPNKNT